MIQGIASHGGPAWSEDIQTERNGRAAQPQRVQARADVLDAEVSRIGALQLTTDDGDTVNISFAALEQLHTESFRGKSNGERVAYGGTSQNSEVSVNISVDGSLDEQEIADISELLGQLSQAIANPEETPEPAQFDDGGSLDSLDAFQFAYQEQTHVDYSSSRVRATA